MITDIRNLIAARRDEDNDEGGFTLIELLIVIVVLGILAAIVVFAVQNVAGDSAQSACKTDAKTFEVAQEAYKAKTGAYAPDIAALVPAYVKAPPGNIARYALTTTNAAGPNQGKIIVAAPPSATSGAGFGDHNNTPSPCNSVT